MAFTETFSLYLLHDLPWQEGEEDIKDMFEKQWALLREGVLYFMRFEEGQHTSERILAAQKALVDYGKIAEEVRCIGLQAVCDNWTRRLSCAGPRQTCAFCMPTFSGFSRSAAACVSH